MKMAVQRAGLCICRQPAPSEQVRNGSMEGVDLYRQDRVGVWRSFRL